MPRRTLWILTALVLAVHWLVLQGVPLAWDGSATPAGKVFTTRSVAAPPPAVAAAPAPSPSPAAAPPAAAPPKPVKPRKVTPARPAVTEPAPAPSEPAEVAIAEPAVVEPTGNTEQGADSAITPAIPTTSASAAEAPAPEASAAVAAAPAAAASAPVPTPVADGSGVDITPPGGTPGQGTSTAAPPVRLPAPIKLAFDVAGQAKKFDYQARAELVWQHDGARYEARQEVSAFLVGSRTQRSTGLVTAQGLQPERFGDRNRSERAAHFDYQRGRVTFSANTPEAAIGPGAQDRLSVFIQLAGLLAATPDRFVPGTQLTLTTVSATGADRWTFTVEAAETLNLPAGTLPTLKLQRLPRRDYDQKAELWLAPDMGYLPVRIKITQANGDFADLRLRGSSPP
ncbi:hypothetical protein RP29_02380 [Acidovorax temperans]|uniref:DUF3108 domain-containing protein n=1 Tax=Acidovorax temperans TaxID=80878 RepID=A0A0D7KCU9_9BURK|nr:DUF3108 domain-containing protein [Acidovorax temperans]KJA11849.1 hypothetical protein RP29_02380 [Acidovorax temperans]